jgi:transcriptional regulator
MNTFNKRLAADARKRRERILKLHGRGLTYAQIAKLEGGCTRQNISRIINKGKR